MFESCRAHQLHAQQSCSKSLETVRSERTVWLHAATQCSCSSSSANATTSTTSPCDPRVV